MHIRPAMHQSAGRMRPLTSSKSAAENVRRTCCAAGWPAVAIRLGERLGLSPAELWPVLVQLLPERLAIIAANFQHCDLCQVRRAVKGCQK
jgi:hypothetical protein